MCKMSGPCNYLNGLCVLGVGVSGGVCVRNVVVRHKRRAVCNHTGGLQLASVIR